jgi:putative Mg2+ transporter-C (MgtC) family protein
MNIETLLSVEPYSWASIGTAMFCGAIIGLERQLRGKPVGIRTSSIITIGTYLFLATSFLVQGDLIDHTRVIGQVITGIGFLGAGVMLAKNGAVVGVTSAATIWVLAAIGVMIASGYLLPAIKLSLLVVAILWGVEMLELHTRTFSRGVHARVIHYSQKNRSAKDASSVNSDESSS